MNKRDENRARKLIYLMKSPNRKSENEQKNEERRKKNVLQAKQASFWISCRVFAVSMVKRNIITINEDEGEKEYEENCLTSFGKCCWLLFNNRLPSICHQTGMCFLFTSHSMSFCSERFSRQTK